MTFTSDAPQALQTPPVTLSPGDWRIAVYGRTCITGAVRKNRAPAAAVRRALELQGNICLYCQIPIGTEILRRERLVRLRRHFDHFVPHAYSARNGASDFVIACHVCNTIKHSNMFATVEEARAYILPKREARGYEPVWSVLRRVNLDAAASRKQAKS
jgi:5-methylcytosine-specific restriction endonuclease McrA